jgi:serine/threonine-protein kinase HipA
MAGRLWVFLSDWRVGFLDEQNGWLAFTYEPEVTTPLSVNLPVRAEPYEDAQCHPFFSNLLPEGGWRQAICRQLRIDENNDFALLKALGSECAGAVTLEEDPEWTPNKGIYKPTTEEALRRWILNPAARPSIQTTPGLRLSLAGAQDKLLIHLDHGVPHLCEAGAPSSVILKPDIRDLHNAVELSAYNELLSSMLAKKCGLNVAEPFWYAAAYAVHRYDRLSRNGKLTRLHQEDFAQIAGVPAANKYEEHGGPGWKTSLAIVDEYTAVPARDRLELLNRLFFNICLGNNDAHAKNFALLHAPEGGRPRLAPAFDLVCTSVYPALSKDMAMKVGGQSRPDQLNREAWVKFGDDAGFSLAPLRKLGVEMANRTKSAIQGLQKEVEEENSDLKADIYPARRRAAFFKNYSAAIKGNCDALIRSLQ